MRSRILYIILTALSFILFACSNTIKLIDKSRTRNEKIRFYVEKNIKNKTGVKRIYASVDSNGNKSFFSFYPDKIVKTTENAKELTYTIVFEQLPTNYDSNIFQKFSSLDSLVLKIGDNLLDSLGLKNFKRSAGAVAYQIEVNYYHGYPKYKKFRP